MTVDANAVLTDLLERTVVVDPSAPLSDLTGWDSLKFVRLVVTLETFLKRELGEAEIEAIATAKDIDGLLGHGD